MNTALNRVITTILTNKSGGALALGDVVVIDTANAQAITITTTADYITTFPGVVIEPAGIDINGQGQVAFGGYVSQVNLISSANIGDKISTSTTNKKGLPNASLTRGTFGITLETGLTPKALLIGLSGYEAQTAVALPETFNARMVLATGTTSYDVYSGTTLYVEPYNGENISVYNTGTSSWETLTLANTLAVPLSLVSGTNYDVFIYKTGSVGVLDFVGWTNNTTRLAELGQQNNILVKSIDKNKRYIGTIRTTAANMVDDADLRRFVWNMYNRRQRKLSRVESTANWTASGATWVSANANIANRVEIVIGLVSSIVKLMAQVGEVYYTAATGAATGIGKDATNANSADMFGGAASPDYNTISAHLVDTPTVGYHFYQWLQRTDSASVTFYATAAGMVSGLSGFILE